MEALDIARWQFGITTVYHFLMVPLTIGLGAVVAFFNTAWVRTEREEYLRLTKFWGKLFLINFIVGVATGLVQEFQFGMAWSEYSRFVGDIFGAPLAMEALLAFFFESTFIGLWIFGWKKLPPKIHLACIWIASFGTIVSAYFIIAANSWMQHPVGYEMVGGRPVLNDIWAVLTNNTAVAAFSHVIFGAFGVAGSFLVGIAWYKLYRRRADGIDTVVESDRRKERGKVVVGGGCAAAEYAKPSQGLRDDRDYSVWIKSLRAGAIIAAVSFLGVSVTGDIQSKLMFEQQPMKMAAAEAACHDSAGFSVFSLSSPGAQDCDKIVAVWEVPGLLGFLAEGDLNAEVKGINTLIPEYQHKYGEKVPDKPQYGKLAGTQVDYLPLMEVTYWGFRLMIAFGVVATGAALAALFLTRKGTVPNSRGVSRLMVLSMAAPFAANIAGWIFTELGRQPFAVAPNPDFTGMDQVFLFTAAAVSPQVSSAELMFSLVSFTVVYAILLVTEVYLLVRYIRRGVVAAMPELAVDKGRADGSGAQTITRSADVLDFAY